MQEKFILLFRKDLDGNLEMVVLPHPNPLPTEREREMTRSPVIKHWKFFRAGYFPPGGDGGVRESVSLRFKIVKNSKFSQMPGFHFPPLQFAAQFARPVFFGAGHKNLAARSLRTFQQRQKTAASFDIEFAHHIVNQ